MNRRDFLKNTLLGAAAATISGLSPLEALARARDAGKLNVLFIMSDQHNAHALRCYGNGQVNTPNLDRIAQQGVRFTNAFTQAGQCCPSRYTILTGLYPHTHGCRWNGVLEPLEEVTVPEIFRDAGYATATIGKHHLFHDPKESGFDLTVDHTHYAKFVKSENSPGLLGKGDWMPEVKISGPVGACEVDNDHHDAGYYANETIRFLREKKDKPFCAWLSFYGPHTPIVCSKPWAQMYDPKKLTLPPNFNDILDEGNNSRKGLKKGFENYTEDQHRQILAYYYGLVSQIDYNIGRVLDELDSLGIADNTLIIYTADHGEMMAEHSTWTKGVFCCEATVRVPMMISTAGKTTEGKVVNELVGLIDMMPTICELAGLDYPEKVQGKSLVPLLTGKPSKWRDTVFSEIGYPGENFGYCAMARTKNHKYVRSEYPASTVEELYDMVLDPWERTNQVDNERYSSVLTKLRGKLADWQANTEHAPMYPIAVKGS